MPSTRERVEEAYNVLARWLRELSRTICASVDSGGNCSPSSPVPELIPDPT